MKLFALSNWKEWSRNTASRKIDALTSFCLKILIARTTILKAFATTSNSSDSAFDLTAAIKESQAISSEIELERLLRSLIKILIETAGAKTGYLILEKSGEWVIEVSDELNDEDGKDVHITQVLQAIPIKNYPTESIINYVIQTHEAVILNNATHEGDFINEPYIQQNQTRSLLCLPLLNQGRLVGVLYLENQLATGTFTSERLQVLHLLSTQAAIAITNAKLYAEVKERENRLTKFIDAMPIGVPVHDSTGQITYANRATHQLMDKADRLIKAPPEQISEIYQVYQAGTEQLYPTDQLPIFRSLAGEPVTVDDIEVCLSNKIILVQISNTPVVDKTGKIAFAITACQDITERKHAEARLVKSETLLRTIVQSVPECVKLLDADGTLLEMNPAGLAMIEADSLQQLQGQSVYPIVVEKYHNALQALTERIFQGEAGVLEFEIVGLKGTHRWVETHAVPSRDDNQTITAVLAVTRDITERKRSEQLLADYNRTLEQQVAEQTAALRASEAALRGVYNELRLREQELRLITDALPALISYVDTNQRYRFVNRTYEMWFNCSRDEILGKSVLELLGETAYHIAEPTIQRAQAGQISTYEAEIPYPTGKRYISATMIPDFDDNAQVRGHYGLVTDISEQRNAALRERKQAEEASILEERNRMAREIHDTLAQSFTGIIIHARAAASKLTVNPEKAQASLTQVQNLARIGLAEARRSVEALRRPYLLENHDLPSAFKQLTTQLGSSTNTLILCEAIGIPYLLPSDVENNLLRIGQEALTNALKHAGATEIRVELIYRPTQYLLRIKDDGQGFTVDCAFSHNGFGLLGMAERADRMRAQLQIQSAPGQGTEITVSVNQEKPL